MTRSFVIAVLVLSLGPASLFLSASSAVAGGEAVNAVAVAEHLDKTKYSSAEIKSYLKDLKGKEIIAHGKIDDILTGKTGTRVVLFVNVSGKKKDFVVDVSVPEPGALHKGERVTCSGEYVRYNMITLNGITIKGSCKK